MNITPELLDSLDYVKETLEDLASNICWDCRAKNEVSTSKINVYIMYHPVYERRESAITLCAKHAKLEMPSLKLIKLNQKEIFYLQCKN